MSSFPENPQDILKLLVNTRCAVIKISASWCGPCKNKTFLESYHNLKNKFISNNNVLFLELDVDKHEEMVNETNLYNFNISVVPTIIVYNNGKLINSYTGTDKLNKVLNDIETLVKES